MVVRVQYKKLDPVQMERRMQRFSRDSAKRTYRERLYSTRFTYLAPTCLLASCVSQTGSVPRSSTLPSPPVVQEDSAIQTLAAVVYRPGVIEYLFESTTVIRATTNTGEASDSSRTTGRLRLSIAETQSPQLRAAIFSADSLVQIDSLQSNSSQSIRSLAPETHSILIHIPDGTVDKALQPPSTCAQDSIPGFFRGDELTPALVGRTQNRWQDTSYVVTCRGGISLRVMRVAAYQIFKFDSSTTHLARRVDLQVTGTGRQWEQPVSVSGIGLSLDTLITQRNRIGFERISVHTTVNLSFQSNHKEQQFTQVTNTVVTAH